MRQLPSSWVDDDPNLGRWAPVIAERQRRYHRTLRSISATEDSIEDFCVRNGIEYYGLHREAGGWRFREWAPCAVGASLVGDFNQWDVFAHPCERNDEGVYEIFLPDDPSGRSRIRPGSRYKLSLQMRACGGVQGVLCVPAWARCTAQDPETNEITAVVPRADIDCFCWQHPRPPPQPSLRLYEVHPGIASSTPHVSGWRHLRLHVLPRVVGFGYTGLLLLGVLEHGYYASFGYQVTSFFAPSSRFGPPHELQQLVDAAHGLGLAVYCEMVHSHASSNPREGLVQDELGGPYFHAGPAGHHAVWGSRLFDYSKTEVLRFLLANVWWWATAYRFDGMRFDAVSTALYRHRCLGGFGSFDGDYKHYFGPSAQVDEDGMLYFKLANHLAADLLDPPLLTIAEDHSGMPGLCVRLEDGGIGFTLRQALAIPPMWVEVLSGPPERPLPLRRVVDTLTNSRADERLLAYCECHDQALMGEQSLAFRLIGEAMYSCMHVGAEATMRRGPAAAAEAALLERVARGIALHKMSRLLTYALAGDAYLNFIGNEWGHPEWLDMPCDANGQCFDKARRRWDLAEDKGLRYSQLLTFDVAMHLLEDAVRWLRTRPPRRPGVDVHVCERRMLVWLGRAGALFVFNFHPSRDADEVIEGCGLRAPLYLALNSDAAAFGGRGRSSSAEASPVSNRRAFGLEASGGSEERVRVRVPSRTVCVYSSVEVAGVMQVCAFARDNLLIQC